MVSDIEGAPVERLLHYLLGDAVTVRSAAELTGGRYNTTVGIVLDDDRQIVMRVAPQETHQFRSELHLMRNELAAAATVQSLTPTPEILAADFSHRIINRDLMLQTWMPGVPASAALAAGGKRSAVAIWHQIGQVLKRYHQCTGKQFGRFVGPQTRTWSDQLAVTFDDLARDLARSDLDPAPIRDCLEIVARNRTVLDTVEPRLLHGDLGPGNVMVRSADDPTIIGLIDCDRAWWGDPPADWTFYLMIGRRPEQREAFWTGYGESVPNAPSDSTETRSLLYSARSEAEACLELHRLGETTRMRTSQDSLQALARRLIDRGRS